MKYIVIPEKLVQIVLIIYFVIFILSIFLKWFILRDMMLGAICVLGVIYLVYDRIEEIEELGNGEIK